MPETLIRLLEYLDQPEFDPAKILIKLGIVRTQLDLIVKQLQRQEQEQA